MSPPQTTTTSQEAPDLMHEILHALGRIEGQITGIEQEQANSRESRARMHTKLEKIEEGIKEAADVAKTAAIKADNVTKLIAEDVKPATDDFKRMRTIGFAGITLIGFAFTALGVTLATLGDAVSAWVRNWLRIP